ncbi:BREX-1 system phosphatase PglZ type A, partial [bacterium]|nr:BREX-1 system phosphatase PglZ type A [bacterium]
YSHLYEAVGCASRFIAIMSKASFSVESLSHAIEAYRKTWFEIDQLYRKYIYHVKSSGQATLMNELSENIENLYSNGFLLKVNDNLQQIIDSIDTWEAVPVKSQREFFYHWVKPYLERGKKVFVIISDALRYEVGQELVGRIIGEDRFEANIEPALSMIPSYTQLGMGALFPNRELSIGEDSSATVFVHGRNSKGSVNRGKILKNGIKQKSKVMLADDLLKLNNDESRELIRVNDIIYFYHNRIDAMGGKGTEGRVFEAAERAIEELITIVKKLTSANANNILITADHGFIYQDREIDQSDFTEPVDNGGDVFVRDRRYIIGKNLVEHSSLKKFKSKEIGLVGDVEIQIPKSINRLRKKAAGSRYVHGGASLQEVIIPIIHVNKKRESDISRVEIDIINGAKRTISSGQFTVVFYQKEPVKGKKQPFELHAGLYTKENELISDEHTLVFDYTSENPREREYKVRFVLSRQAEKANNQDVILKLEEQVPGTSHRREYKTARYLLRRTFMSDFDF